MLKKIILYCIFCTPILIMANPSPFGLQIEQVTISDVKSKYKTRDAGINKYSQGKMLYLNPKELNFEGLKEALAIFSKEDKLLAVLLKMPKKKFNNIFSSLNSKYKLENKKIPFVGNKSAKFIDGNTEVMLNAPHMGFTMDLHYVSKNLWKTYNKTKTKEQKQKKQKESSQL